MNIGIIGAGNVGGTTARLFIDAGHEVAISNSRGPAVVRKNSTHARLESPSNQKRQRAGKAHQNGLTPSTHRWEDNTVSRTYRDVKRTINFMRLTSEIGMHNPTATMLIDARGASMVFDQLLSIRSSKSLTIAVSGASKGQLLTREIKGLGPRGDLALITQRSQVQILPPQPTESNQTLWKQRVSGFLASKASNRIQPRPTRPNGSSAQDFRRIHRQSPP